MFSVLPVIVSASEAAELAGFTRNARRTSLFDLLKRLMYPTRPREAREASQVVLKRDLQRAGL